MKSTSPQNSSMGVLLASLLMIAMGVAGCSSSNDYASHDPDSAANPASSTASSRMEAQASAFAEDPNKFCSPDEVTSPTWFNTPSGTVAFAYLPTFVGTKSEIESELDNDRSSSTYVPYSTDKILLAAVSQDTDTIPDEAVSNVEVKQVVEAIKDGKLVSKCGPKTTLKVATVGQTTIKYMHDDVWYTKRWTLWELSGDKFNPLPKDRNSSGFSANIESSDSSTHALLRNNRARLPSSIAQEGVATQTPDPGMSLIRYYYEQHVWA